MLNKKYCFQCKICSSSDKLPIRGGKKLSSINTQKELIIESSDLASENQAAKGKEKVTSMDTAPKSSESEAPKQTTKGKEKVTSMDTAPIILESEAPNQTTKGKEKILTNTTLKSSGSPLNNLVDSDTVMRNKLAAANSAAMSSAASPWKGKE